MAKISLTRCDRPGCGIEFTGKSTSASVTIRRPPLGDIGPVDWDLCDKCAEELRRARIDADLAFGDRMRPPAPTTTKETDHE